MQTAILYRQELKEHDFGLGHPFRSDRYRIFMDFFREYLSEDNFQIIEPGYATDADLLLVHSEEYISFVESFYKAAVSGLSLPSAFRFLSGDNIPRPGAGKLNEAARLIVGSSKLAGEIVWEGKFGQAVALGGGSHHASSSYGEGFCLYNDVAICARNLRQKYGLDRILILDTDAHAGNGTAEIFYHSNDILFIDLHQDPRTLYPGKGFAYEIGSGGGEGYTVNVPLPLFAGYNSYELVLDEIVFPLAEEFKPQIIIRNGGSDPHFADELTQLGLTLEGFRMIGAKVRKLAKLCDGKVVDLLGSGYNLKVLPLGWLALICGLTDTSFDLEEPFPIPQRIKEGYALAETKAVVKQVKRNLKAHWSCFA